MTAATIASAPTATAAATFRFILIITIFAISRHIGRHISIGIGGVIIAVLSRAWRVIIMLISAVLGTLSATTIATTAAATATLAAIFVTHRSAWVAFHAATAFRIIGQGDAHFHRIQISINLNRNADTRAAFNFMQLAALIIQQIDRHILRQMHAQFAFAKFTGILINLTQHMQGAAFNRAHHAGAVTMHASLA